MASAKVEFAVFLVYLWLGCFALLLLIINRILLLMNSSSSFDSVTVISHQLR